MTVAFMCWVKKKLKKANYHLRPKFWTRTKIDQISG